MLTKLLELYLTVGLHLRMMLGQNVLIWIMSLILLN